jgi:acyl-CoA synthetase (NDP forming)
VATVKSIISRARGQGRLVLTEIESKELLKQTGITVNDAFLATTGEEAVSLAQRLGFPVVLKIASGDIVHKSDGGGVKLGLKTSRQVANAYEEMLEAMRAKYPRALIQGVSVQKMARPGVEVIIGVSQDAQFGPVVMFGLGGILVEVLKDVSLRVVPLAPRDAAEMVREIKGHALLEGYRGQEPVDTDCLEDMLLRISGFVEKHPEIKELDLNPVLAYPDGAIAVDARVVLG